MDDMVEFAKVVSQRRPSDPAHSHTGDPGTLTELLRIHDEVASGG